MACRILIQTALRAKTQEIYVSLSITDCTDYNIAIYILQSYEMVPEAYRQKFRDYQKEEKQTYIEFFCQEETF